MAMYHVVIKRDRGAICNPEKSNIDNNDKYDKDSIE